MKLNKIGIHAIIILSLILITFPIPALFHSADLHLADEINYQTKKEDYLHTLFFVNHAISSHLEHEKELTSPEQLKLIYNSQANRDLCKTVQYGCDPKSIPNSTEAIDINSDKTIKWLWMLSRAIYLSDMSHFSISNENLAVGIVLSNPTWMLELGTFVLGCILFTFIATYVLTENHSKN